MTVEELTELRKNDWCIDEILKGIAVREDVIQRTAEATYLTDARKAECADEMNAEKAHGYAQIENMLRNPLPFREASEKPEELESIFVVSRVTDWDSDNMRFIPTPDCVFRFDESPYPGSRDAFTEFDLGWIYEADILRIFRAWKEGKRESITAKEGTNE